MLPLPSTPKDLGGTIVRPRQFVLPWIACMVLVADVQVARAWIQIQTQDGFCFAEIPVTQPMNLEVVYEPTFFPEPPGGISAIEFRLDLGSSPLFFSFFTPNPAANVVGNVTQGIRLEFPACEMGSPTVLGSLAVIALKTLTPQSWFVRGGGPGSGICPQVQTCAPESAWLPVYRGGVRCESKWAAPLLRRTLLRNHCRRAQHLECDQIGLSLVATRSGPS